MNYIFILKQSEKKFSVIVNERTEAEQLKKFYESTGKSSAIKNPVKILNIHKIEKINLCI